MRSGARQTTAATSSDRLAVRPGVIYTADGQARIRRAGRQVHDLCRPRVRVLARQGRDRRWPPARPRRHTLSHPPRSATTGLRRLRHARPHADPFRPRRRDDRRADDHAGRRRDRAADRHRPQRPHRLRAARPPAGRAAVLHAGHRQRSDDAASATSTSFPIAAAAPACPTTSSKDWAAIFDEIFATPGVKVAILNHARDLHSGVRPFGPELFNAAVGENLDGWPMRFNAMEVINSGATQTDPLRLLARLDGPAQPRLPGHAGRQQRLARRGPLHRRPGADLHPLRRPRRRRNLDVDAAVKSFLQGDVLVSYGLLASLDVVRMLGDQISLQIAVQGPAWTTAIACSCMPTASWSARSPSRRQGVQSQPGSSTWKPGRFPSPSTTCTWLPSPWARVSLVLTGRRPSLISRRRPTGSLTCSASARPSGSTATMTSE